MVIDPVTIAVKVTEFIVSYVGRTALNDVIKDRKERSAFEAALRDTLIWYRDSVGDCASKKELADALLLTQGPLFNDDVRNELVLLLDFSKRPNIECIASVWQCAVGTSPINADFRIETERLLEKLKENLSCSDAFRAYMQTRVLNDVDRKLDTLIQREQSPRHQPEIKSSLDGLYPSFYYPLQLGRLVWQSKSIHSAKEEKSNPLEFPIGWRESEEHVSHKQFERENADTVWQRYLQKGAGIALILGEPGSGKTTLTKHWYEESRQNREDIAAFRLRDLGRVPTTKDSGLTPRLWLLDGWDELPVSQRRAEHVATLPGLKIVTCRTASYHGEFDALTADDRIHYVMGMLPQDQRAFLLAVVDAWQGSRHSGLVRQRLAEVDALWADNLWQTLQSDDKLRELVANPLLLTLIALVSPPGKEIKLPKSRAQFYQEAFYQLCQNRHPAGIDSLVFTVVQAWLVHLVASENVQRGTEISPRELDDAYRQLKTNGQDDGFSKDTLLNVALTAGLLKDYGHHYEFLHLTFQEWCLAQANIQQSSLVDVVKRYWQQPDYQEVLALTWSLSTAEQRKAATEWLIDQRYDVRIINGKERTFSGLRTALHLWRRSGVSMAEEGNGIDAYVWNYCQTSELRKIAIAVDRQTPGEVLAKLAEDHDANVRQQVAENVSTPAEALTRLAADDDRGVRMWAAWHASTPAEALTRLAVDDRHEVRREVAGNASTPAEALTWLAADDDHDVRGRVAGHASTPAEVLTRLAVDDDHDVRRQVAGNASTPAEVLTRLAADDHQEVRQQVAENASTPAEALTRLAADDDHGVRWRVARNASTSAEVFTRLAADDNQWVVSRWRGMPVPRPRCSRGS